MRKSSAPSEMKGSIERTSADIFAMSSNVVKMLIWFGSYHKRKNQNLFRPILFDFFFTQAKLSV